MSNLERDTSHVPGRTRRPRVETVDLVATAFADTPEERIRLVNEARAICGYAPLESGSARQPEAVAENRILYSVIESHEDLLLRRITVNPGIFGGKPIIRGRRLAVEHVLGMLAAGDSEEIVLNGYPWLEREDIQACLSYARRMVARERIEPLLIETGA